MCSIELGRIDILMEVTFLSQHLCSPREGRLDTVYHIFKNLQKILGNKPGRMAYNPKYESSDENVFEVGWKIFR